MHKYRLVFIAFIVVANSLIPSGFVGAQSNNFPIGGVYFSPSEVPLDTILARYFAWRGGSAYTQLRSYHAIADRKANGSPEAMEIWFDRSGRWRQDMTSPLGIERRFGRSPTSSWISNGNGQVENDPLSWKHAQRMAEIEFGDALREGGGAELTLLGVSKWKSLGSHGQSEAAKDLAWVRVTFGDSDCYDVLIDPNSGALSGYIVTVDSQKYYYLFGDWRFVDGIRMPFWRMTREISDDVRNIEFSNVETNIIAPSDLFDLPPSRSLPSFDGGAKSTGWIKFVFFNGMICFPASINGRNTYVYIDNGVTYSIALDSFYKDVGLHPIGDALSMPSAFSSSASVRYIRGLDIKIGNMSLKNMLSLSTDKSNSVALTDNVPVIIGNEAFINVIVNIDFPNRQISFSDPSIFVAPEQAFSAPLVRNNIGRVIKVSLEDKADINVLFDLGFSEAIGVFPNYARDERLFDGRIWAADYSRGVDDKFLPTKSVVLRKVRLGPTNFYNVPAVFPPLLQEGRFPTDIQGTVGLALLSRYQIVLDYSHDLFYAIPNLAAVAEPFPKDHLGAAVVPEGARMKVLHVSPTGPAVRAGLKAGDQILEIDGKPADMNSLAQAVGKSVGETVELTLSNGDRKRVLLTDYY